MSKDTSKIHEHYDVRLVPSSTEQQMAPAPSNSTVISFPEVVVNHTIQDDHFKSFDFNDRTIRAAFIRKVYSIVMLQLSVTLGFICFFEFHLPTKMFVQDRDNIWLIYMALGFYLVTYFCMLCCEGPRRLVPYNYIFLGIFTTALSLVVGFITSFVKAETVLLAAGITFIIVASLTLFAFQTKIDFTMMSGSLLSLIIVLITLGLFAAITRNPTLNLLYAGIGVLVFSLFLVYDTQLMVGGDYKYALSPEEYVFAALNIYLDVMNIFLKVLRLLR